MDTNPDAMFASIIGMKNGEIRFGPCVCQATAFCWNVSILPMQLPTITPVRSRAVVGIVQQWAQTNPALAASWVEQFPAGTLRDTATQNLLSIWTSQDAAAAGKWVEQLPVGNSRDTALAAYQTALAQSAIIAAAQQATNTASDLSPSLATQ